MKKKVIVFTGAGISKESGIPTYRDLDDGLWGKYDFKTVASIEGWHKDRELVLEFYNKRRAQLKDVEPNQAHILLAKLEEDFDVTIITQNVDNLHEKAGSTDIIHLHGLLTEACSSNNKGFVEDIGYNEINIGDKAEDNSQLRPNIVWFGEDVPKMYDAMRVMNCTPDYFIVIGTSLQVYPAAGLLDNVDVVKTKTIVIDPNPGYTRPMIEVIKKTATEGIKDLIEML